MNAGVGRRVLWFVATTTTALLVVVATATGEAPWSRRAWRDVSSLVADKVESHSVVPTPAPSAPASATHSDFAGDASVAVSRPIDAGVHRQTGPLSNTQLGAPLVRGGFLRACGAPDDMKVVVDVAVHMGHAVRASAKTHPKNAIVAACVVRAVRQLQWDVSPKTGHVTVSY